MLKITSTEHLAGIRISGDWEDLNELYDAIYVNVNEKVSHGDADEILDPKSWEDFGCIRMSRK